MDLIPSLRNNSIGPREYPHREAPYMYQDMITDTGYQHNDYWKLDARSNLSTDELRELLGKKKYQTSSGLPKAALRVRLWRCDLGMPVYNCHNNKELRDFLRARAIEVPRNRKGKEGGSRADLIELLEDADEHRSFHKFLDLPAEVRNKIYELYFAGFRRPIFAPSQPPLSMINRQLRQETLTMFYSNCTFTILFQNYRRPTRLASPQIQLTVNGQLRQFLQCTPPELFKNITKLRIIVQDKPDLANTPRYGHFTFMHPMNIKIDRRGTEFEIDFGIEDHMEPDEQPPRFIARMLQEARRVVRAITAKPGEGRLAAEDVLNLRRALEIGMGTLSLQDLGDYDDWQFERKMLGHL